MSQVVLFDRKTVEDRDYWLSRLPRVPPRRGSWSGHPRRRAVGTETAETCFEIGGALYEQLARLTENAPFLIYTSLLAALEVCLARHTGDATVIVGSPCRRVEGAQPSNVLALLDVIDEQLTFRELLLQVRSTLLEAYAHQSYPFELLLRDLGLQEDGSGCPLFDVALALEGLHAGLPDAGNAVTILFRQQEGHLTGRVRIRRELAEPVAVERLAQHLVNLLREALNETGRPLRALEMLSPEERWLLAAEWNDTRASLQQPQCVHRLFEACAASQPGALAVADARVRLTYRELNERANQVARHLQLLGIRRGDLAAVCLPSSVDLTVAILAVLKTGGAYAALDPTLPIERLAFMLEDAAATVLIARQRWPGLEERARVAWVDLEQDRAEISRRSGANLHEEVALRELAYVIYTSGSTGAPKGVSIEHGGLLNLVAWHQSEYQVTPRDRASQLAGPGFDASVWEIWPYLAAGASVHFPDRETALAPARLLQWLAAEGITLAFLPTPMAEVVLDEPWPAGCALRALLTGGDTLHRGPRRLQPFLFLNHYGPTEGTVVTTWGRIDAAPATESLPSIGRPITNARAYLLDRDLRLVPPGLLGEICIAGAGLARGYLRRPDTTAERFVPDPFSEEPGGRLYRTGDLARYLPQGQIEFLGRIDHQVKIRGYRIELEEIEVALDSHPAVLEAVVDSREGSPGEKRLVAYIVPREGGKPEAGGLRAFLRERLPEYMIPAGFVILAALPLTPNGKVDRRALPAPPAGGADRDSLAAPRSMVEEVLAGIWAEVLGRERIGLHEGFFELGGHSLLATQVMSRLRDVFGLDLPLRNLFDQPTVAGLAGQVESARRQEAGIDAPVLAPVARTDDLPLSFAQERLWFLDCFAPGRSAYNIPTVVRLDGRLDVAALRSSLEEVVRRHEALRTRFGLVEAEPVQIVAPPGDLPCPRIDLAALPEALRDREARHLAGAEAARPFDLSRGPLIRAGLLRSDEERHLLVITMHHIISDGWSMGILIRELTALYTALSQGLPSPLAPLPLQYADFAVWQRRWLQGEMLERQLSFWRAKLQGLPPSLELPTDRPRPAVQTSHGTSRSFSLSAELSKELKALSRNRQATLFMTLLAGFAALLSRYTAQGDIVVGTPIAGRNRVEIEGLIGFFVNTLVMPIDLAGPPRFNELLERVRQIALEAHAHQDLPFEKLVQELAPERSMSHTPLFQVMFALQNIPGGPPVSPGPRWTALLAESTSAKFDLSLALLEREGGLIASLEYRTDLFDEATILRLAGHFRNLLASAVADAERPVPSLVLGSDSELHQILTEWTDTRAAFPEDACIHELFAAQVERTPDAVAVVCQEDRLSYRELAGRAGRWAYTLRSLGVGPEVRVAICMERSLEMLVALVAVLETGGAYVPLDAELPQERRAYLLEDSRASVLLTQRHLARELPERGCRTICLDEDAPALADSRAGGLASKAAPENLAYVIYTSGSTGRPKGVMVPHRGLVNRLAWARQTYPLTPDDRVLQIASFSFDFSFWECLAPLLVGAPVVLARPGGHRDSAYLVDAIVEHEITVVHFVPSMLQVFLAEEGLERCRSLRRVLSGGEALPLESQSLVFTRLDAELRNQYGPTEVSIDLTDWVCRRDDARRSVPIGRPLWNTSVLVLDRCGEPCPIGVPGELYLGGVGVARGYMGRADLTAERFVPDRFGTTPGGRLYRTGDLGRWWPDGTLEFLGRTDDQVKVRGFRIELGEINAALAELPGLEAAVAVAREQETGGLGLVAYLVPEEGCAPLPAELRSALAARLPDYMIPSSFVTLPALPLTPTGKIDRQALPAPESAGVEPSGARGPRTVVEEILAGLWSELLGRERIGVEADFFSLGGHSLLATRVTSRVRKVFGVEVPLRALFEAPTVAGFAQKVEDARRQPSGAAPPIEPVARTSGLPLSFAQQRLWFLDQMDPGASTYNLAVAWQLAGRLHLPVLSRSIAEVVRRHEVLHTVFPSQNGEPVQQIAPAAAMPLQVADLGALPQVAARAEARRLIAQAGLLPFDLSRGPLFRAVLVRLGEEEHRLLLAMHHIVSDGWSLEILRRELQTLYAAFESGRPSPLAELPIQYADYAGWQRQWLQGEPLQQRLAYWKRQLAGAPPETSLPADRPRPAVQDHGGASVACRLAPEVSAALRRLVQQQGATLFMGLLAAFKVLLMRSTGQCDVVVGTPIAGRNRWEIEDLIGFFVNTLVLRSDLGGDPDFLTLLERVRETSLEAHLHQDLPFEKLVEELRPERSLSHSPLFQVMFDVASPPAEAGGPASLSARPVEVGSPTAKLDLTVSIVEHPQGLLVAAEHSTALFDRTTVLRMLEHYAILLADLTEAPSRHLSELSLLSPAERAQLSVEWNDTGAPELRASRVQDLFEAQVERCPEAVAIEHKGASLSYGELNARANRLAHHLRTLGVGPETAVVLLIDRSIEMIIGLLAVLKAGGFYVPLDPASPRERLARSLEDCGATVVLTRRMVDGEEWRGESAGNPAPEVSAANAAYVIYTSGSTGAPRGVVVQHRALAGYILAAADRYGFDPAERVLQFASVSFDTSAEEIYPSLASGAALVLRSDEMLSSATAFLGEVERLAITVLDLPTAFWHELSAALETEELALPPCLRLVIIGGEAALPERLASWHERVQGRVRLVNSYGPTEATIVATLDELPPGQAPLRSVPIGRPIRNARIHLLDAGLLAVPIGVAGELCVAGSGLARGYLGRPELTAERFIPDPFGGEAGQRLYRTGDLTCYLPDGRIEFLGRRDHQVKVRGFRIELGEVEAALAEIPGVGNAAVVARERRSGGLELVAYVVAEGAPAEAGLRSALAAKLPDYMIPGAFVFLPSLPLTPTGKLDRQALPAIEAVRAEPAPSFVAPRDTLELRLAQIWEDLLDVHPVGVRDDFFALGGHSLLTVRLASRVQRLTGRSLSLTTFFQEPTIERLSQVLRRQAPPSTSPLVPIHPAGSRRPLCFVHPVGGHALGYLPLARHLGPDRPFYVFQAEGLDGGPVRTGIEEMAKRYVEELLAFQPVGPHLLGGWSLGGLVGLEMARLLEARGQRVAGLLLLDSVLPNGDAPVPDDLLLALFARDLGLASERGTELARVQPGEGLATLLERARGAGVVSPDLEMPVLERFFAVFRANFRAMDAYRAGSYPGPARLLLSQRTARSDHPAAAWRAVAPSLSIHEVPGDHYTMMREPHVQVLAREVDAFCSHVEAGLP